MNALGKFALAAAILVVAIWQWPGPLPWTAGKQIDRPAAEARAQEMLGAFIAHSGERAAHFGKAVTVDYPDGWDFSWAYLPCPATARLRIFIHRNGQADYGETPNCNPLRGFGVVPQEV